MSAFTSMSIIERLDDQVEELKAENEALKKRVVAMTSQLAGNRIVNKKVLNERDNTIDELKTKLQESNNDYLTMKATLNELIDARDYEIDELKTKLQDSNGGLEAMRHNWNVAKQYTDDVISQRNSEVASLKKELAEQIDYTERAIAHANNTENDLFMKNAELTTRIAMITDSADRQAVTIYRMEMDAQNNESELVNQNTKLLATEEQLASTKAQLDRANQMLTAIGTASSYITDVLSHRQ